VIDGFFELVDLFDILVVASLFWSLLVFVQRTRARLALTGLAFLGVVYLVARQIGLRVTAGILQGFFAVLVIVVVVVFQEDLRRFFEQIASWGLRRRGNDLGPSTSALLVAAVRQLASRRTGALIVMPGREDVARHLEGGFELRGRLSEPLLISLFDPHSPGHDGAVVVRGDSVERFGAVLPLSADRAQLGMGGTRHAAALGLAERCDALCVVVSEERGTVSVAHQGRLRELSSADALSDELRRFLRESEPEPLGFAQRLRGRWREAALSLGLAFLVWVVFVPGSTLVEVKRRLPVVVENLPDGYLLESVSPERVEVRFTVRRRDLYLANRPDLAVRVDALLVQLDRRTFGLAPDQVSHPEQLTVVAIDPPKVKLAVRRLPETS
jgi:uncharacterized protein (TIGR00159 family)